MAPTQAVQLLKGSDSDKRKLFDFFVEKAVSSYLEDWEGIMLEALKKDLVKPAPQVLEMSAKLKGVGGVN